MRTRFWTPFGIALLMGGLTSATSVRPLTLQQLASGADEIVYGRVERVESFWNGQKIETDVTLVPSETWKGSPERRVVVRVPGGTVAGITMVCSEAPTFRNADDVVCFLKNKGATREVYGWYRGQYTIVRNMVREIPNTTLDSFRTSVSAAVGAPPQVLPPEEGK
jgi:hypothetical protein